MSANPNPRELDVVARDRRAGDDWRCWRSRCEELGLKARSYTGGQVAHPHRRCTHRRRASSRSTRSRSGAISRPASIVIVAGFQGVDSDGNITTLGRGGSDTSGVALAAALKADECQIYTDVDGVYTTDPRIVPEARRLDTITFEEMLELASQGSKVLQIRSVEFAGKYWSSCACCRRSTTRNRRRAAR